jgi:hypothetical protein
MDYGRQNHLNKEKVRHRLPHNIQTVSVLPQPNIKLSHHLRKTAKTPANKNALVPPANRTNNRDIRCDYAFNFTLALTKKINVPIGIASD